MKPKKIKINKNYGTRVPFKELKFMELEFLENIQVELEFQFFFFFFLSSISL